MIAVLQRVSRAKVTVDGEIKGEIGKGFMILLGVAGDDCEDDAELLAEKISKFRVFCDENGKMNLSVKDIGGEVLVVPNFTLLASYRKGNRPDFFGGASPDVAKKLFDTFVSLMKERVLRTEQGVFGADMKVELVNDGPVTVTMDSNVLKGPKNGF